MKHILKETKGQSLIEIVVAVGIITVVLVGVSDIISRSLSLASFNAGKNTATNIAQSQLNYYRGERDKNPTDFFINPNSYKTCVGDLTGIDNCEIGYSDITNGKKMTVTVKWSSGGKVIDTTLSQDLSKLTK